MTENQWPQTVPPASTEEYPDTQAVPAGGVSSPLSKKDVAKDEAAAVAGQAAGAVQNVAGTARAEAANVAAEVKTNAGNLVQQAKSDLSNQAGVQQQKAAEGIRTISSQLHTMAEAPEQQGIASDLIRQAADRSASVASWLENRDPGSLLEEVTTFARQRPGTFLLLAAGAGILAGRLGRSLQAGAPATSGAVSKPVTPVPPVSQLVPPVSQLVPPVSQPVPPVSQPGALATTPGHRETVIAAGAGDRFFDEPTVRATGGPASTRTLPAGTAADTSLRADSAPFPDGEGRHL